MSLTGFYLVISTSGNLSPTSGWSHIVVHTHVSPENVSSKSLGQEVGALIIRVHIVKLDRCRRDHIADPVVLDVNVLGPLVMNWILRELTS
jgi:hypothetical protein